MRATNVPDKAPDINNLKVLPGLPVLPPRNALIELAIFFAIIVGLEFGLGSLPDLNELEPHPFWLPVLLLSLQYGTVSGLLAAGVSILFTTFMGWPEQDIGENHFNYLIRIWAEPVLWIAAALVIGQFRMRQISERCELHRNVQELQSQRTAIAAYSENLRARCERLERQIAGRGDPTSKSLLDAFTFLGSADPMLFQSGFGAALETLLGPGQYSLFAVCDDTLRLAACHGWRANNTTLRKQFEAKDPFAQRLLSDLHGLTIMEAGDEKLLAGQGYAAVPVRSHDGSRTLGVLKVEQIHPERIGTDFLMHLELIAAQLAPSLELLTGEGVDAEFLQKEAPRKIQLRNWRKMRWEPARTTKPVENVPVVTLKKPKIAR